ncbi:flagellar export chaperone FliS [Oleiharenicola lentus]|jgi:flagellar protein FliS|uniref:Flagellar secretion chaperone FliS n=1 Tax=Oleiharenicola lentus TaxID=2508720 RepID=A0A4Q1C3L9_9BACT|nr:flagellar export chaperone FliS [Oleiharenicola lentus]RXK52998.1 flagellar export chaperone FliS [Oleiharenicola lentus]
MYAQNYARTYRANSILTASPGQLVLLLFDAALNSLAIARKACDESVTDPRKLEVVHSQLVKAQKIIAELQGTLNLEAGGEFARTMYRLYDYYDRRLLEANLKKESAPIAEVERLLGEVRNAWSEMLRQQEGTAPQAALHHVA